MSTSFNPTTLLSPLLPLRKCIVMNQQLLKKITLSEKFFILFALMKNLICKKNLLAYVITKPTSSLHSPPPHPPPHNYVYISILATPFPLWDYLICERSLSCFIDNSIII